MPLTLKVKGPHCNSCIMLLEDIMEDLNARITKKELDEQAKEATITIETDTAPDTVIAAIKEEAGYEAEVV